MSSGTTPELDAVRQYLLQELTPQTRLDYYELTNGERALLRAMCASSKDGQQVGASGRRDEKGRREGSLEWLAMRSGLSKRQVWRLLNGYKREGREVKGLEARGLITKLAEANEKYFRPAIWRINWFAFEPDAEKIPYLESRMQRELPGIERAASPEHTLPSESTTSMGAPVASDAVENPVEIAPTHGHGVHGAIDTVSMGYGHGVHGAMDTVSTNIGFGSIGSSSSSLEKNSAAPKSVFKKRWSWNSLHPGIYRRLAKQLQELSDSAAGFNPYGRSPEEIATRERQMVLRAAERAEIWPNVAQDLAQETYEAALERAIRERGGQN
jgi:hypothetical protein